MRILIIKEYRRIIQKKSSKKKFLLEFIFRILQTEKSITQQEKRSTRIVDNLLPNFIVHLTNASDVDIKLVARKKSGVVCPRANGTWDRIPKVPRC
jgi:hypothetical protein